VLGYPNLAPLYQNAVVDTATMANPSAAEIARFVCLLGHRAGPWGASRMTAPNAANAVTASGTGCATDEPGPWLGTLLVRGVAAGQGDVAYAVVALSGERFGS